MIIAIDQSLTKTACASLDWSTGKFIGCEIIYTEKLRGLDRLKAVRDFVINFILENKGDEKLYLAREGYSYGSKQSSSVFELGELGGIIDMAISDCDLGEFDYYIVPPTQWKMFAFNDGATKKDTGYLLKVFDKFGIKFNSDDEADAFMIGKYLKSLLSNHNIESMSEREKCYYISSSSRKKLGLTVSKMKKITQGDFDNALEKTRNDCMRYRVIKENLDEV